MVPDLITLTEEAQKAIKTALEAQGAPYVRLGVRGGGCSGFIFSMDTETEARETDFVLDFNDFKILIDPMSAPYLKGTDIGYMSTLTQTGFTFNNPNQTKTCGCGKSFSV